MTWHDREPMTDSEYRQTAAFALAAAVTYGTLLVLLYLYATGVSPVMQHCNP